MTQMMNQQCVLFLFYIGRKHNELGRTNLFKYILYNKYKLRNYCKPETYIIVCPCCKQGILKGSNSTISL